MLSLRNIWKEDTILGDGKLKAKVYYRLLFRPVEMCLEKIIDRINTLDSRTIKRGQ